MKKFVIVFCIFLTGNTLIAQTLKDDVEMVQGIWGKEKKALAADMMDLTAAEITAFGPVYDAYLVTRKELGMERLQLIKKYVDNLATMNDAIAAEVATGLLKNNVSLDKLHLKYFGKFSKALNPVKAAQWLQTESYIDAVIRMQLQESLPFIERAPVKKN